jgi:hypothetical protein
MERIRYSADRLKHCSGRFARRRRFVSARPILTALEYELISLSFAGEPSADVRALAPMSLEGRELGGRSLRATVAELVLVISRPWHAEAGLAAPNGPGLLQPSLIELAV